MSRPIPWNGLGLIASILFGCNAQPEVPQGTGARECALSYFEALVRCDWPQAYAALDPASQKRCNLSTFSQLAQSFHNSLGFEPATVYVRACEEHGAEATAHLVLTGHMAQSDRRYKDGVTLNRSEHGWHVVLPQNFGRTAKR